MRPIGRHHTSGLSFMLSAMRFFFSSTAHGSIGRAKPRPATSPKLETGTPSGGVEKVIAGVAPAPPPRPPPPPRIQIPEKSTLPSAVRGGAPVRMGAPLGSRGTSLVGYEGHCAASSDDMATSIAITAAIRFEGVTFNLPDEETSNYLGCGGLGTVPAGSGQLPSYGGQFGTASSAGG